MGFGPTPLRYNTLYVQIYVVWMKFFLVELLPYVTIVVLNAFMIVRQVGSRGEGRRMGGVAFTAHKRHTCHKERGERKASVC